MGDPNFDRLNFSNHPDKCSIQRNHVRWHYNEVEGAGEILRLRRIRNDKAKGPVVPNAEHVSLYEHRAEAFSLFLVWGCGANHLDTGSCNRTRSSS